MTDLSLYMISMVSTRADMPPLFDALGSLHLPDMVNIILSMVLIIQSLSSIANCYFGYRIFRIMLAIQGFLTGAAVGALIGILTGDSAGIIIIIALLIGAIGGLISWFLYKVGVFFYCLTYGFLVGLILLLLFGAPMNAVLSGGLIIALIAAILGVIYAKHIIIFITASSSAIVLGQMFAGLLVGLYFKGMDLILAVVFAVTGILCQFHLEKKSAAKKAAHATAYNMQPAPAMVLPYAQPVMQSTPVIYNAPIVCRECGAKLPEDAMFCEKCGKSQQINETVCKQCGEIIPEDALFCKCCGAKNIKPTAQENLQYEKEI